MKTWEPDAGVKACCLREAEKDDQGINWRLDYTFRGFIHCHHREREWHRKHGGRQADMVLEKKLRV